MGNFVLSQLTQNGNIMKTVSLPRGRHTLHAMPTSTGYEMQTSLKYDWDGRKRGQTPFTVLQHTLSGTGNLRYENRHLRIEAGQTLLVLVPHNHRYWLEPGGRWEYFWISMNGAEALRIHQTVLAATGPVLTLQPNTIKRLAECSLRLINGEGETPGMASAIAYEAAMLLYDDVFNPHATETSQSSMRHVLAHILANLHRNITVDEMAAVAGLSRAHFTRLFAESEGLPPAEYVLSERMRRAAKLFVVNPAISIKEVANLTGFEDANYFSKVFRRFFGASPTEFRTTGMYTTPGT
jgi:AraC-like DNA-binding protein